MSSPPVSFSFLSQLLPRVAGLFLLVSVLAGCGNNPNPPPLHTKKEDGSPWLVRYGAMNEEARSLDPQVAYDQMSRTVLEPVYDTLLEYHPMKTDPYEVVPGLLESMPERTVNPDGSVTYLCRLKKGVMFQDDPCFPHGKGRELVAQDVHYAWQRMSDPKVECPVLSTFQESVAGMAEAYEAAKANGNVFDYSKPLKGLEVVDSHTFRIHLIKPYPQILYWMAMHFTTPVAREAVEYYDGKDHPDGPNGQMRLRPEFKWHPVSTGPYRIYEHKPNASYRLVANPNYTATTFPTDGWPPEKEALLRPLAGKKLPLIDEVQLPIIREQLPAFLLTRQGYLDRVPVGKDAFNSVVTASLDLAPEYKARGLSLEKDVTMSTFYISLNTQDPVLGPNKKLRQALSASFDARSWVDIFYNGVAEVAQQLISPGIYGFQRDFKNPYGYNLEKAKQLMVEAGYPNGIDPKTGRPLELTLDAVAGDSWQRQTIEFDQRCMEKLGIKVRVVENTFARMLEKEDQGNYQMASGTGWGADYPDPENFYFLFYSKNFPPAGKNISFFKNEEFDRLFEQMATMENSPERLEIVHRMNEIFAEECPVILNFNKAYFVLVQPWAPRTQNNQMLEGGIKYAVTDPVLRDVKQREWNRTPKWPVVVGLGIVVVGLGYAVRLNRKRNA